MSSFVSKLLDFIDERLSHMLDAPEMWGSGESVELQILQLLELRVLVLEPTGKPSQWRLVQADYERFLATKFPSSPPTTLSALLGDGREDELPVLLRQFVEAQQQVFVRVNEERNVDEIESVKALLELGRIMGERDASRRDTFGDRPVRLGEGAQA
jgi:hypothetical protein